MSASDQATAPIPADFAEVDYLDLAAGRSVPARATRAGDRLVVVHRPGCGRAGEIDRWPVAAVRRLPEDQAPPRFAPGPDDIVAVAPVDGSALATLLRLAPAAAGPPHAPVRRVPVGPLAAAALVSVLVILFVVIPQFAGTLARFVPPSVERWLGERITYGLSVALVERQGKTWCATQGGREALNAIVARVLPDHQSKLTIRVVQSNVVNAFAAPGGHVTVTSGIIEYAGSPEALAGIIAHEAGHASMGHAMESVMRYAMLASVLGAVTGDFGFGLSALASERLLTAAYSQEKERAADAYAFEALRRGGVSPVPMADFFGNLRRDRGDEPSWFGVIASHPAAAEREATLRAAVAGEQTDPLLSVGEWTSLRMICGKAAKPNLGKPKDGG